MKPLTVSASRRGAKGAKSTEDSMDTSEPSTSSQSASASTTTSLVVPKQTKSTEGKIEAKDMVRGRAALQMVAVEFESRPPIKKRIMQNWPMYAAHARNMDLDPDVRDSYNFV